MSKNDERPVAGAAHPASETGAGRHGWRRRRMRARDIEEQHRASTTLELLFDLVIVVAVGAASSGLHHAIVHGTLATDIPAFFFAFFCIWLAWWNYSWFASAYDVDDARYRLTVFAQMVGAMLMAVGLPEIFAPDGNISVCVGGFVLMRLAMVAQWLRAASGDPRRARTCRTYAALIALAQSGWCAMLAVPFRSVPSAVAAPVLATFEVAIPFLAESHGRIPWHPHHIAERHGLLVIIVLGEGVLGAVNDAGAIVRDGAALAHLPGVVEACLPAAALSFAIWWHYFHVPFGKILERHREAAVPFGYFHFFVFAAIAALGASFEVVADAIAGGIDRPLLARGAAAGFVALLLYAAAMLVLRLLLKGKAAKAAFANSTASNATPSRR